MPHAIRATRGAIFQEWCENCANSAMRPTALPAMAGITGCRALNSLVDRATLW